MKGNLFLWTAVMLFGICVLGVFTPKSEGAAFQKALEDGQWHCLEGRYCVVYYQQSREEGEMTMRAADLYYPLVAADFQWKRTEKPIFMLYHDKYQMKTALGLSEKAPIPMGAYQGGRIAVLSPSVWAAGESGKRTDAFLETGPVAHELVHFAMDDTVKGGYPTWLTEGVALYYEKKYTGFEWRPDLKDASGQLNPETLRHSFQELPVALAYRKSFDLVEGYVNAYGETALQNYIRAIGNEDG